IGQFCAYPNFSEIAKYTGALKPGNLMIFRDFAAAGGILEQNKELAHASGRLQVLCYKEEIEAALRTKGEAGIQLLDLHRTDRPEPQPDDRWFPPGHLPAPQQEVQTETPSSSGRIERDPEESSQSTTKQDDTTSR
ncbi:MAG: hypothetical protein ACXWNX_12180, partial [Isosphaeraceae bacterium]